MRVHRACLAACSLLLFAVSFLPGQSSADADLTSMSIEDLAAVKVISASRHAEDAREAPSAVSVITAEEIQRYGWRTLGDILNSVRGFYVSYDRNYTYLGAQGVMRPGDYNSRILLLIDGHRLNDNIYDAALLGTEFPLDLDLIDHIEIIRGPSSSLYGSNALFGVINVITRGAHLPSQPLTIEASGDFSSLESRTGSLAATIHRGPIAALLSGSIFESAGAGELFFPDFNNPTQNYGFAQNLDGDRSAHSFAALNVGDWNFEWFWGSRRKIVPTASFGTTFDAAGTRTTDTRSFLDIGYKKQFSAATDFDAHLYYDRYLYNGNYVSTYDSRSVLNRDRADSAWLGGETTISHDFGRSRITAGASYEYGPDVEQQNYDVGGITYLDDHRTVWLASVYGEFERKFAGRLTLHLGGRIDHFDAYGTPLSPRVAAIYALSPQTSLKYILGRAFRAPNAYETYYADGVSMEANLRLRPEHIVSHQLVLEYRFAAWIALSGTAFYSQLANLIDQVQDPSTGMLQFVNEERDRTRGLEMELDAKRASGLALNASYTITDARTQSLQTRLDNSPLHLAKLRGTLPCFGRGFAALELLYSGAEQSYQQTRVSPYLLTNFTLSTTPIHQDWELSASVYNMFDRRWSDPAGTGFLQPEVPQDGRSYRVKLLYRFRGPEGKARP